MMRLGLCLVLGSAVFAGCAAPPHGTTLEATWAMPVPANLALGASEEDARLATLLTDRSDWPSVDNGYRMDDLTMYVTTTYDVQSHYDRYGSLYNEAQSVRTGVRVR